MATFLNSGQICMLAKRIYVHEKIYDAFKDDMVEFAKHNVKTGSGFEQNSMQFDIVKDMYAQINKCGRKMALEGKVRTDSMGFFIEPAIVDTPQMTPELLSKSFSDQSFPS
ncbi:Fc.00g070430.m01.CDS01 [Cosmosporella sp. VM-42]